MITVYSILIILSAFIAMEGVAWFVHKYIMHGWLWSVHKDHHTGSEGFFERNDFFFLVFAIPGILLLYSGYNYERFYFSAAGAGITLYGLAYLLVHDIFIHQRFRLFRNTNNRYLKALRRAHKMHHKHLGKQPGESFGMLFVHPKYFRQVR